MLTGKSSSYSQVNRHCAKILVNGLTTGATMRNDYLTRFKKTTEAELDSKVTGVRLPVDIGEVIRSLPPTERSAWLRRVISEAAQKELLNKSAS